MQNNLIISLALNYAYSDLKVFLESLNKTSFKSSVYLIVNNNIDIPSEKLNFKLHQVVVNNLRLDSNTYRVGLKEIFESKKRRKITQSLLHEFANSDFTDQKILDDFSSLYHCQTSRYAEYLKILLNNRFDNVFLTDSRDVYFQSNPFENSGKGLHVFQENVNYAIKDRPYNNQWVKLSTNFWSYLKVRSKQIYCSGTILGDYDSMIKFLKLFLQATLQNNLPFDIKGIDQGLFNVLIHTNKINNFKAHSDQKQVLTLSAMDSSEYNFDKEGLIYNANGYPPAVVHQYDRHDSLITLINKRINDQ